MTVKKTAENPAEKRTGLRWTLFFHLAVFCLVVLLLIWIVQAFLIDHIYYGFAVYRMDRAADYLASPVLSPDDRETVRAVSVKNQANVEVYYRTGGELGALFLQASGDVGNALVKPGGIDKAALCREA